MLMPIINSSSLMTFRLSSEL